MSDNKITAALQQANVPVLANAIELGAQGIIEVAGNAITNQVDGKPVTPAFLHLALATRLQSLLANNAKQPQE